MSNLKRPKSVTNLVNHSVFTKNNYTVVTVPVPSFLKFQIDYKSDQ